MEDPIYYLPSGYVKIAIENGPVEIVDLPSYKMVDLSIVFCMFTRPGMWDVHPSLGLGLVGDWRFLWIPTPMSLGC
jgi:hypothetical protein